MIMTMTIIIAKNKKINKPPSVNYKCYDD